MDRSDTSRDGKGEPVAGQSSGAADQAQPAYGAAQPAELPQIERARIHRAPPRPLVPRAYRFVALPRAASPALGTSEIGLSQSRAMTADVAPPLPLAAVVFAQPVQSVEIEDGKTPFVGEPVCSTQASLPPALVALDTTLRSRQPLVADAALVAQPAASSGGLPQVAALLPLPRSVPDIPAAPSAERSSARPFQSTLRTVVSGRTLQDAPAQVPATSSVVRRALRFAGIAIAAYFGVIFALLLVFRFVDPPFSSLMLQQRLSGVRITNEWTDIENISPQIVRAVLLSEDGRFCQHHGVDLLEMQAAIERAGDGAPRGASTISMQVIKNLFLWPSKSYVRKAIEIPLTYVMELLWSKQRIMEVYLNIAEWGPGIFGVGAASQFHFDKAASRLNEREAAQLAVALPNPYSRDAGDPGPQTRRLASDIQNRMRSAYPSQTACVLAGRAGR